jgi:hypothetical protein
VFERISVNRSTARSRLRILVYWVVIRSCLAQSFSEYRLAAPQQLNNCLRLATMAPKATLRRPAAAKAVAKAKAGNVARRPAGVANVARRPAGVANVAAVVASAEVAVQGFHQQDLALMVRPSAAEADGDVWDWSALSAEDRIFWAAQIPLMLDTCGLPSLSFFLPRSATWDACQLPKVYWQRFGITAVLSCSAGRVGWVAVPGIPYGVSPFNVEALQRLGVEVPLICQR